MPEKFSREILSLQAVKSEFSLSKPLNSRENFEGYSVHVHFQDFMEMRFRRLRQLFKREGRCFYRFDLKKSCISCLHSFSRIPPMTVALGCMALGAYS